MHIEIKENGDVTDSLYSALKVQEYCDSTWATLRSYLRVPSHTCPNDPDAQLDYILKVLTVTAYVIYREDGIPPLVVHGKDVFVCLPTSGGKSLSIFGTIGNK